jgi:hypothetical protein
VRIHEAEHEHAEDGDCELEASLGAAGGLIRYLVTVGEVCEGLPLEAFASMEKSEQAGNENGEALREWYGEAGFGGEAGWRSGLGDGRKIVG